MKCILCNKNSSLVLGDNPSFPKSQVYECEDCRSGFTHPLPNKIELELFYKNYLGYGGGLQTSSGYRSCIETVKSILREFYFNYRAKTQYAFFSKYLLITPRLNALDIGCGTGSMLKVLNNKNMVIKGFEPDLKAVQTAKRRLGKNSEAIIPRSFKLSDLERQQYDLIIASHLIEHLTDPIPFLSTLKSSLRTGGILFIEVPNDYHIGFKTILNPKIKEGSNTTGHLFFHSSESIRTLLEKCHFKILKISTCGCAANTYAKKTHYLHRLWIKFFRIFFPKNLYSYRAESDPGVFIRVVAVAMNSNN